LNQLKKNREEQNMTLTADQIQRIAGFELNALRVMNVLGEEFENVSISSVGTPIYDINGEILFYRLPLSQGDTSQGYVDIAANEALGGPLLSTSMGIEWDEKSLLQTGTYMALKERAGMEYNSVRFVAFSYPKIALQFLLDETEVLMLELYSWMEVPPSPKIERNLLEPSFFERWSLLDELPKRIKNSRIIAFNKRIQLLDLPKLEEVDLRIVSKDILPPVIRFTPDTHFPPEIRIPPDIIFPLRQKREINYSTDNTTHDPCFELFGQRTNVWCVAASVEMLLRFYRYSYDQVRLAQELGLGTLNQPNGLPYANDALVATVIEKLSSNTLDATMYENQDWWKLFRNEINANRPVISFVPGHSRVVAGYYQNNFIINSNNTIGFRGLLVYDPWPPNLDPRKGGVITKYENFDSQIYRVAYTAVLRQI